MMQKERLSPVDWIGYKLSDEGFDVYVKDSRDGLSAFVTVVSGHRQCTRRVIHDFTMEEMMMVYWDLSSTIHRLERHNVWR